MVINILKNKITINKGLAIIFFTGIFLILFSLLRFRKWSNFDLMILGGIGILLAIFSISIYRNAKVTHMSAAGFTIGILGVIWFSFVSGYLSDIAAIIYALGIAVLITDILFKFKFLPPYPEGKEEDIILYKGAIQSQLTTAMEQINGLVFTVDKTTSKCEEEVKNQLLILLGVKDRLERIQQTSDSPDITRALNKLQDDLESENVSEIMINQRDSYNPEIHYRINEPPENAVSGIIKVVKSKGYHWFRGGRTMVLRKADVEVEWHTEKK